MSARAVLYNNYTTLSRCLLVPQHFSGNKIEQEPAAKREHGDQCASDDQQVRPVESKPCEDDFSESAGADLGRQH